jgi:hypothetical protein
MWCPDQRTDVRGSARHISYASLHRQPDDQHGPTAIDGVRGQRAVVHLHHAPGCGQTQSATSMLGRDERFEEAMLDLGVNARTIVADSNLAPLRISIDGDLDTTIPANRLSRILKEIEKHHLQL